MQNIKPLTIDGKSLKKLINYKHKEEPLWASDAGRNNMSGDFTGTFVGYFTKLTLEIGDLNSEDTMYNLSLLEKPFVKVKYEDRKTGVYVEKLFYTTTIETQVNQYTGLYTGYTIELTAVKKS